MKWLWRFCAVVAAISLSCLRFFFSLFLSCTHFAGSFQLQQQQKKTVYIYKVQLQRERQLSDLIYIKLVANSNNSCCSFFVILSFSRSHHVYCNTICWASIDHWYASCIKHIVGYICNSNNNNKMMSDYMMRCDYLPMLLFISVHVMSVCIPVNFNKRTATHKTNSLVVTIAALAILSSILLVLCTVCLFFVSLLLTPLHTSNNLKAHTNPE